MALFGTSNKANDDAQRQHEEQLAAIARLTQELYEREKAYIELDQKWREIYKAEHERQKAEFEEGLVVQKRQQEVHDPLQEASIRAMEKEEINAARLSATLDRWEQQMQRMDVLLAKWEAKEK